jgi:hypothetical protein
VCVCVCVCVTLGLRCLFLPEILVPLRFKVLYDLGLLSEREQWDLTNCVHSTLSYCAFSKCRSIFCHSIIERFVHVICTFICTANSAASVCLSSYNKMSQTEWQKQENFSQFWRSGSPRSKCQLTGFLIRAFFLAYR